MKAEEQKTETPSQTKCSIPCNICSSTEVEEIGRLDRDGRHLRSVICRKCGLSWSDPRPNENEIKNFYAKDYRLVYKGTYKPKPKHIYRAGKVARQRYEFIKNILKTGEKILDVGSGGGEFIFLMRHLGFDAFGLEPNEGYGIYAKESLEIPIKIGFIQQAELSKESFQIITLHHVLEHLDNPFAVLVKLHKALKNDGFLIVEVPNIEGVCFAPQHRFHKAHLYNFNRQNLELLGRKADFSVFKTVVSKDGGVITTIFQKSLCEPDISSEIAGNYDKIAGIIKNHTNLSHYLSPWPYRRPINKLLLYLNELKAFPDRKEGKNLLEKLFQKT